MDAIALHAAGFHQTVASLGTAFTEEQAALLKRSASRVLLNFDSDEAGQRAARLALSVADRTGLDVAIVRVAGAKDPDELLHEPGGSGLYQLALDQAISAGDFLIEAAAAGKDMNSVTGRRSFVQERWSQLMPCRTRFSGLSCLLRLQEGWVFVKKRC